MKYKELDIEYKLTDTSGFWPSHYGLYVLVCRINGKVYVGMTRAKKGFKTRWSVHRKELRKNRHGNKYLQRAYNKYGESNFYFKILKICNNSSIINIKKIESLWINKLNSTYSKNGFNMEIYDKHYKKIKLCKSPYDYSKQMKTYQLISPNGEIITFTGLAKFARENSIDECGLAGVISGNFKSYKGYKSINTKFHHKIKNRKFPYLIRMINPKYKHYTYNFMFKGIKYRGFKKTLKEIIISCQNKLKELNADIKLRIFLESIERLKKEGILTNSPI